MNTSIPFNKPFLTGKELEYIRQAVEAGKISGNGAFTQNCQRLLEQRYGFRKALLTTSCTDALEMAAMLAGIRPGDEVIMPSFTFVSTALAFVRQGAKIVFADSDLDHPNLNVDKVAALITSRTKVLVVVHYAGVACDMDAAMALAEKHGLLVIEDAAQAIDATYKGRPLGGIGHLGCFSFHETKNVISGEGGALVINDDRFPHRAEIIWEKGTNRAEFFRGEVNKYGWVDIGSSFLPSEITAAFLYAQLEQLDAIQTKRKTLWTAYRAGLFDLAKQGRIKLPALPLYASNNAHMFYIVCRNLEERSGLIKFLKEHDVMAPFHYLALHKSEYYLNHFEERPKLPNCDMYADCLVRMPMFYELELEQVDYICELIKEYYTTLEK